MADKWQTEKSYPVTNMRMLDEEMLCDVTFLAGESKQCVKAHRFILASRSPVFNAMFCGPLAESSDTIQIPDVEVDILRLLLRYLYTAECQITPDVVMPLLYAANKYDVVGLARGCKDYLESNMDPDNVCTILQQAHVFAEKALVDRCTEYIEENCTASLASDGFESLSREALEIVLRSDHLSVDEEDVYAACMKWAAAECKRTETEMTDANCRSVLGDALFLIRFPLMTVETFTPMVSERDLLSSAEKVDLFQYFAYQKQKPNIGPFSDQPRSSRVKNIFCRFSQAFKDPWAHCGKTDAISFSCSKHTYLRGVGLFSPSTAGSIQGKLDVYEGEILLTSKDIKIEYEKGVEYIEYKFSRRIEIKPDTRYTLAQTCSGVFTYYGEGGQETILQDGLEVTFGESDKNTNGTHVSSGQFQHLHFFA